MLVIGVMSEMVSQRLSRISPAALFGENMVKVLWLGLLDVVSMTRGLPRYPDFKMAYRR